MQKRFAKRLKDGDSSVDEPLVWCRMLSTIIAKLFGQFDLLNEIDN
jgi:hypothetical protein